MMLASFLQPTVGQNGRRKKIAIFCHFHAGEDVCRSFFLKALEGHRLPEFQCLKTSGPHSHIALIVPN